MRSRQNETDPLSAVRRKLPLGTYLTIALIVVIGVGLRAAFLNRYIRSDEATIYHRYVSHPIAEIVTTYDQPGNHVLHSALTRLATLAFGSNPLALRLPAFIAGILILPATFVWAKQEYGWTAGLLAAGLAASSSFLVDYSTRARGYSMVALFFVLALILAGRLTRKWDIRMALALACVNALALYTIPVAVYSVSMVLAWLAIGIASNRRHIDMPRVLRGGALMLGVMALLTAVLYLPIVLNNGLSAIIANRYVVPAADADLAQFGPLYANLMWQAWISDVPPVLIGIMLAGFAASVIFHRRIATSAIPIALAAAIPLAMIALQRVVPPPRTALFLTPVYLSGVAGAGASGLGWLSARMRRGPMPGLIRGLAVFAAASLGWMVYAQESITQWDLYSTERAAPDVAAHLAGVVQPGDGITGSAFTAQMVSYYLIADDKSIILITGDLLYPFPQPRVPSRLFVVVDPTQYDPLRMARYTLGQIDGFDPTAYTAPELIKIIDDVSIYLVTRR
jgi:uncharacterized membrane protein